MGWLFLERKPPGERGAPSEGWGRTPEVSVSLCQQAGGGGRSGEAPGQHL